MSVALLLHPDPDRELPLVVPNLKWNQRDFENPLVLAAFVVCLLLLLLPVVPSAIVAAFTFNNSCQKFDVWPLLPIYAGVCVGAAALTLMTHLCCCLCFAPDDEVPHDRVTLFDLPELRSVSAVSRPLRALGGLHRRPGVVWVARAWKAVLTLYFVLAAVYFCLMIGLAASRTSCDTNGNVLRGAMIALAALGLPVAILVALWWLFQQGGQQCGCSWMNQNPLQLLVQSTGMMAMLPESGAASRGVAPAAITFRGYVLGDSRVGKTELLRSVVFKMPAEQGRSKPKLKNQGTEPGQGAQLNVPNKYPTPPLYLLEEPGFRSPASLSLANSHLVVLCFSLTDRRSLFNLTERWAPFLAQYSDDNLELLLVGLKAEQRAKMLAETRPRPAAPRRNAAAAAATAAASTHEALLRPSEHPFFNMTCLPSEVLLRIFEHLETPDLVVAMQVCKRWRKLANHRYVWAHRETGAVTDQQVKQVCKQLGVRHYMPLSAHEHPEQLTKFLRLSVKLAQRAAKRQRDAFARIATTPDTDDRVRPLPAASARKQDAKKAQAAANTAAATAASAAGESSSTTLVSATTTTTSAATAASTPAG